MSADLGDRLLRAGLVERDRLDRALATEPRHEVALVRSLLHFGASEDALLGHFVDEGFGPPVSRAELEERDRALEGHLTRELCAEFSCLPLERRGEVCVVAMAVPSAKLARAELERALGAPIEARAARWSDLRGDLGDEPRAEPSEGGSDAPIDPPVFELARRRTARADEAPRADPRPEPVPLVRLKPNAPRTPPPAPARPRVSPSGDGWAALPPPSHAARTRVRQRRARRGPPPPLGRSAPPIPPDRSPSCDARAIATR